MVTATAFNDPELEASLPATNREWSADNVPQPHQRDDRPPFCATHELLSLSPADGQSWREERFELMVIDGLAYSEGAWEGRERPEYDVDHSGTWWDLEQGRVVDRDDEPTPLPARYVGWQDAMETPRVIAVEPGGIREVDVFPEDGRTLAQCFVEDACPGWAHAMGGAPALQAMSESLATRARWEISAEAVRSAVSIWPTSAEPGEPAGHRDEAGQETADPAHAQRSVADPFSLLQAEMLAWMTDETRELLRDGERLIAAQHPRRWEPQYELEPEADPHRSNAAVEIQGEGVL